MRGLVLLLAVLGGSAAALVAMGRAMRRDAPVPVAPCDSCGRMTTAREAHSHHHEPGCGGDGPRVSGCRCVYYLCPACCPCDIAALLEPARG